MEPVFKFLTYLYEVIALMGVLIIMWGALFIFSRWIILELSRLKPGRQYLCNQRESLRHKLGSYLLMGLEFMIAADIIATILHPTLMEMALLGSIVIIRTVISYFLDKEIADAFPEMFKLEKKEK